VQRRVERTDVLLKTSDSNAGIVKAEATMRFVPPFRLPAKKRKQHPNGSEGKSMLQRCCMLLAGMLIGMEVTLPALAASIFTVDSVIGLDSSLQLNGDNPVVSYEDLLNGTLKVATCTTGCGTASATWVIRTLDYIGAGFGTSLQLNGGNPVVSYHNTAEDGSLKLATCTADCATSSATWVITTVDRPGVGAYSSLQIQSGKPVISYRDSVKGDLKLATCTAGCATATPTWVITTIDSLGNVGRQTSLRLNNGNPVVSYYDVTRGNVKLATCTAGCATATPTWVITTVDSSPEGADWLFSMQLYGGNPVISYHDRPHNALKVATCTAGCATATPTWIINIVDQGSMLQPGFGQWSSMELKGGNPVVSYHAFGDLKLAECTAGCASATPTWIITTLDGEVGPWMPSLQIKAGNAFVTYGDAVAEKLNLAVAELAAPAPVSTGTVVEYFHATFDHYFTTDIQAEIAALDAGQFVGWSPTGQTFKVFPLASDGASDVCRFFTDRFPPTSSHFYTPISGECEIVKGNPNWQFEGYVFGMKLPDVAANCPAGTVALYRLYNDGRGGAPNHRYTTSLSIHSQMVGQGWIPEGSGTLGVIGCVPG
jgi:hypothetical protein